MCQQTFRDDNKKSIQEYLFKSELVETKASTFPSLHLQKNQFYLFCLHSILESTFIAQIQGQRSFIPQAEEMN